MPCNLTKVQINILSYQKGHYPVTELLCKTEVIGLAH